ncbi:MAG: hypothetical protein ABEK59_08380 [Halobacteria archaeon]
MIHCPGCRSENVGETQGRFASKLCSDCGKRFYFGFKDKAGA